MKPSDLRSDKGILKAETGLQKFSLKRYEPVASLAVFIEHYWVVSWNLNGQAPFRQTILSYPNVNLAFEYENNEIFTGIYGVPTTTYTRLLNEEGIVVGVKFKPGGLYPFWKQPVSLLNGKVLGIKEIFGLEAKDIEQRIFAMENEEDMVQYVEQFLLDHLPEPDDNVELINRIVQITIDNRQITKVEDIVQQFGLNKRTLQRLFSRYVGVSPKWVIMRYRLQEVVELMEKEVALDWPKLAQDMGYFDQAHFIKDFKAIIGKSPEEYLREMESKRDDK